MNGQPRLAGKLIRSMPSIVGAGTGLATGQGFLGSALAGGLAQLGESAGRELFENRFSNNRLIDGLTESVNNQRMAYHNSISSPDAFAVSTNHDVASVLGSVAGSVAGTGLGLIGSNVLRGMFNHSEPQEVVAASSIPIQQVPVAVQAQSPPEGVIALNAEQVKKAQQRAMEQAALNQYYAQQLAQYPVQ
jgi:hypothetical protein